MYIGRNAQKSGLNQLNNVIFPLLNEKNNIVENDKLKKRMKLIIIVKMHLRLFNFYMDKITLKSN